jgi:hypothetical protein
MKREKKLQNTTKTAIGYEPLLAVAFYSYLPYKPLVVYPTNDGIVKKAYLTGINESGKYYETTYKRKTKNCKGDIIGFKDGKERGHNCYCENMKLILKPISFLTRQELEEQGFNSHIDYLTNEQLCDQKEKFPILKAPYDMIQYLLSKHYDVFYLITKNLAVSI